MSSNVLLSNFTVPVYLGVFFLFCYFRFIEFSISSVKYERIVLKFKGTVMQIEKALINDCLRVSK